MIYVLIIITAVYGSSTVAMQEFSSEKTCIAALNEVVSNSTYKPRFIKCLEK